MARAATGVLGMLLLVLLTGCTQTSTGLPEGLRTLISDKDDLIAVAECLSDRGWDAELTHGAVGVEVPADQAEAYEHDSVECWNETGLAAGGPLSEADYEAIYEWYSTIADCLRGAGFDTPERPSYQDFTSTYGSGPWIPWSEVPPADLGRATDLCPVMDVRNG